MRDRLIKLIKDIVHPYFAETLADHLLANGVIVPPCKVGDTVYYLGGIHKSLVKSATVEEIIASSNGVSDLLVNSENRSRVAAAELIAEQLKPLGIKLTVVSVSFQQYQKRLANGEFQLYLGEVNITENMDISSLVVPGGSAAYGVKNAVHDVAEGEVAPATVADIVNSFYSGKAEITDVVSVLQTEMPIIPVCYRTGVMFCDDNLKNVNGASQNDVFLNISSYKLK